MGRLWTAAIYKSEFYSASPNLVYTEDGVVVALSFDVPWQMSTNAHDLAYIISIELLAYIYDPWIILFQR